MAQARRGRSRAAESAAAEANAAASAAEATVDPVGADPEPSSPQPAREPIQRSSLPRSEALSEMAQLDRNRKEESGEYALLTADDPDTPTTEAGGHEPPEIPEATEPPVTATATPSTATAEPPKETKKLLVDDVEYDVPLDEIAARGGDANWQMWKASRNRLDEAKAARDDAVKVREETAATKREIAEYIAKHFPEKEGTKTVDSTADAELDQQLELIRYGTPEEARAAYKKLFGNNAAQVNPKAVTNQAMTQINRKAAIQSYLKDYADLEANPHTKRLVRAYEQDRLSVLPKGFATSDAAASFDWNNFYTTIANEVRTLVPRQSQPASSSTPTDQASQGATGREQRKEAAASQTNPPTAQTRAATTTEEKPRSRAESLNEMRKARGQQPE